MDIDHLSTYVEAVRLGSFSEAARTLSLSQPGISRRIRRLERELGVSLLDRSGGRLTPTREGLRFLRFAERVLEERQSLLEALNESEQIKGALNIAASNTPGEYLLPDLLSRFLRHYPNVTTSLAVMDSNTVETCVAQGHCDVGFLGKRPDVKGFAAKPIAEDEIVLAFPKNHPFAQCRRIELDRLPGEPFIARQPGSGTRTCVEEALRRVGYSHDTLRIVMEMSSCSSQLKAIALGHGIGFVPKTALSGEVNSKVAFARPAMLDLRRTLYMMYDERRKERRLQAFVTFVEDAIGSFVGAV